MNNRWDTLTGALLFFILGVMVVIAGAHHQGTFSMGGFLVMSLAVIIALAVSLSPRLRPPKVITSGVHFHTLMLFLSCLVVILGFVFTDIDMNGFLSRGQIVFRTLGLAVIASHLCLIFYPAARKSLTPIFLSVSVVGGVVMKLLLTRMVQQPLIDVFDTLKFGHLAFLSGRNPYQDLFGGFILSPLPTDLRSLLYGPPLLLLSPLTLIANDPRLGLIASELILVLLIIRSSQKANLPLPVTFAFVNLLLFHPLFVGMTVFSWTDPFHLLLYYLGAKAFLDKRYFRSGFFWVTLSLSKYLYAPPFLFLIRNSLHWFKKSWKGIVAAVLIFLVPFLIIDAPALIHSLILRHLSRQITILNYFSLGLHGFVATQFKHYINPPVWWGGVILGFLVLLVNRRPPPFLFEYATALLLLIFWFPFPLLTEQYFIYGVMVINLQLLYEHLHRPNTHEYSKTTSPL